jgi:hypothetical protein
MSTSHLSQIDYFMSDKHLLYRFSVFAHRFPVRQNFLHVSRILGQAACRRCLVSSLLIGILRSVICTGALFMGGILFNSLKINIFRLKQGVKTGEKCCKSFPTGGKSNSCVRKFAAIRNWLPMNQLPNFLRYFFNFS